MYLFWSASQRWEPCPRTMNGGSPPTEPKARTGELPPPGIICSARFCNLREASTFLATGSSRCGLINIAAQGMGGNLEAANAGRAWNSLEIHLSAIFLQHEC